MTEVDHAPVDTSALFRLDGRVAVVTGASSGLGQRFARVLCGAGATVVVAARRKERLDALMEHLPRADAVFADLEDDKSLQKLARHVAEQHGGADILVNNAGSGASYPAEDEPIETFRRVIEVNLVAQFRLTQLIASQMLRKSAGSVVNLASIFGFVAGGDVPLASYGASKAGLVNLTRDLAVQWASRGVRVNAIAPGYFLSEMTERRLTDPDGADWIRRSTPLGRSGEAHELDGALLYLASDASSFMTGQTVVVDGGWTAR